MIGNLYILYSLYFLKTFKFQDFISHKPKSTLPYIMCGYTYTHVHICLYMCLTCTTQAHCSFVHCRFLKINASSAIYVCMYNGKIQPRRSLAKPGLAPKSIYIIYVYHAYIRVCNSFFPRSLQNHVCSWLALYYVPIF